MMPVMSAEKFWKKVSPEPNTGCWLWAGAMHTNGYGGGSYKGRAMKAHQMALMFSGVEIPKGSHVCHRCDNKFCVNPEHLYVGDRFTNAKDAVARGRYSRGEAHAKKIAAGLTPEARARYRAAMALRRKGDAQ